MSWALKHFHLTILQKCHILFQRSEGLWSQIERHWLEGANGPVLCGSVTRAVNVDPAPPGGPLAVSAPARTGVATLFPLATVENAHFNWVPAESQERYSDSLCFNRWCTIFTPTCCYTRWGERLLLNGLPWASFLWHGPWQVWAHLEGEASVATQPAQ